MLPSHHEAILENGLDKSSLQPTTSNAIDLTRNHISCPTYPVYIQIEGPRLRMSMSRFFRDGHKILISFITSPSIAPGSHRNVSKAGSIGVMEHSHHFGVSKPISTSHIRNYVKLGRFWRMKGLFFVMSFGISSTVSVSPRICGMKVDKLRHQDGLRYSHMSSNSVIWRRWRNMFLSVVIDALQISSS